VSGGITRAGWLERQVLKMNVQEQRGLRSIADAALIEKDGEAAARLYDQLIDQVKQLVGDNQKDIAAELQRLAKEIEADGRPDDAFEFKQRTCAVLLKLSMAARGRPSSEAAVRASAQTKPTMKIEAIALGSEHFDQDLKHYLELLSARPIQTSGKEGFRTASLAAGAGPLIMLCEGAKPGWTPIFSVEDSAGTVAHLERLGWRRMEERLLTSSGEAMLYSDAAGGRIALISRRP